MFFFLVAAVLTMSIIYKGSPSLGLDDLSAATQAIAIVITALVVSIISILFWMPYVYAAVVKKDHSLRWYHFFQGPLLWKRQPPASPGEGVSGVPDYRIRATAATDPTLAAAAVNDSESAPEASVSSSNEKVARKGEGSNEEVVRHPSKLADDIEKYPIEGSVLRPKNMWLVIRYRAFPFMKCLLLRGLSVDIHDLQQDEYTAAAHARAVQYITNCFSFLDDLLTPR